VQKVATANYQVTITAPGFRMTGVTVTSSGANVVVIATNITATSFLAISYQGSTGSGLEAQFMFTAVGIQT
jgi:hypothetical protein